MAALLRRAAGPAAAVAAEPPLEPPNNIEGAAAPNSPHPPHPVGVGAVAALIRRAAGPGADNRMMSRLSDASALAPRPRSHGDRLFVAAMPDLESGELGTDPRPMPPVSGEPTAASLGWDASAWIPASMSPGAVARQSAYSSLGEADGVVGTSLVSATPGGGGLAGPPAAARPSRSSGGRPGSIQRSPAAPRKHDARPVLASASPPHDSVVLASDGLAAAASSVLSWHPSVGSPPPASVPRPTRRHSIGPALAWPSPFVPSSSPHSRGAGGELRGMAPPPVVHLGSQVNTGQWLGPPPVDGTPHRIHLGHAASPVGFPDPHHGSAVASGQRGSRRASLSALAGLGNSALWAMPMQPPADGAPIVRIGTGSLAPLSPPPSAGYAVRLPARRSSIALQPQEHAAAPPQLMPGATDEVRVALGPSSSGL